MWLAVLPGRFQSQVLTASPVNHPEEVVVGARHHDAADRRDQHQVSGRTPPGQRASRSKTLTCPSHSNNIQTYQRCSRSHRGNTTYS